MPCRPYGLQSSAQIVFNKGALLQVLGVADVKRALHALNLKVEVIEFDSSTATSQQAAANIGCQLGQIVKSLGFMINKATPTLVLASGDQSIDERKLAKLFGVGRKKVRMMTAEQCISYLGYTPGGVPPVGLRCRGMAVYLDQSLRRFERVYAAGGAAHAIFPIRLDTLQEVTGGVVADLVK